MNFSQLSGISIGDLELEVAAVKEDYDEAKKAIKEAKSSLASFEVEVAAAFLANPAANPCTTTSHTEP